MDIKEFGSMEELCEMCYELCKESNWNSRYVKRRKNLTLGQIKKYAKKYMLEYLNVSAEEFDKVFLFFLNAPERNLFERYGSIIKEMVENKFVKGENLKDKDWIEQNLRLYICKFCYKVRDDFGWYSDDAKKYCDDILISYLDFCNLSDEYVNKYSNLTRVQKEKLWERRRNEYIIYNREKLKENPLGKYAQLLTKILSIDSEEEIISIIDSSEININDLKNYLNDYIIVYHDGNEVLKNELLSKIRIYMKKVIERRKIFKEQKYQSYVENNIEKAREIIIDFIKSDYSSLVKFCSNSDLKIEEFKKYVEILKDNDTELYDLYSKKQELLKTRRYNFILEKSLEIVNLIINGIVVDGKKRDFDILDYYEHTKMDFNEFLGLIKGKISLSEQKLVMRFVGKYHNNRELKSNEISNIYKTQTIIDVEFDKYGNIIPGSGREITTEEKQNVIMYLNSKNIPITNSTYNIAFRRWISGEISFEETKKENKAY